VCRRRGGPVSRVSQSYGGGRMGTAGEVAAGPGLPLASVPGRWSSQATRHTRAVAAVHVPVVGPVQRT
jgi:hypothetical protein